MAADSNGNVIIEGTLICLTIITLISLDRKNVQIVKQHSSSASQPAESRGSASGTDAQAEEHHLESHVVSSDYFTIKIHTILSRSNVKQVKINSSSFFSFFNVDDTAAPRLGYKISFEFHRIVERSFENLIRLLSANYLHNKMSRR